MKIHLTIPLHQSIKHLQHLQILSQNNLVWLKNGKSGFMREWQQLSKMSRTGISQMGNFSDTQAFGKFPRYPGIWEIPQIPVGIWGWYIFKILEISQMPDYLGNFPKPGYLRNFPDTLAFWEIPIFDIFDNCCHSLYTSNNWNLWYAIFFTADSIVYKYCTRLISRHLYSEIFKDPLEKKYKIFKNRRNVYMLCFILIKGFF